MSGAALLLLAVGPPPAAYVLDGQTVFDAISRAYLGGDDQETALFRFSASKPGYVVTAHSGDILWAYPPGLPIALYGSFYARLSDWSGQNPDTGSAALNTWHQLDDNVGWFYSSAGVSLKQGSGKLEIATDSGGSNIVATATLELALELT